MSNLSDFNKIITLTTRATSTDAYGQTQSVFTSDIQIGARITSTHPTPGVLDGKRTDSTIVNVDVRDPPRTRMLQVDDEFSYRNEPWIIETVNPDYFKGIIRLTARRDT